MAQTSGEPDKSFWVKDSYVNNCSACRKAFSMTIRKHHCRNCGEIFCSDCSSKQIQLTHLGYPPNTFHRVCESCFTQRTVMEMNNSSNDFINIDDAFDKKVSVNRASTGKAGYPSSSGNSSFMSESDNNNNSKNGEESSTDVIRAQVIDGLKKLYKAGVKPLEVQYKFDEFYSPILSDADFDSKPMILLIGQYSVGKTTFIRHLLQRDFPGMLVGPEPTTDKFMIISEGQEDASIPGNALAVQSSRPFRSLQRFGTSFLNKLENSEVKVLPPNKNGVSPGSILKKVTFVDTPGVLSGEKQRIGRSYDFPSVVEWFAGRCDRILLLFDAHKLDISDEFQSAMAALRGHDDKIRVVLNKADNVDAQQLMRVHGALMWSLGKIIKTPEVVRVYVGSFWDEPIRHKEFEDLFRKERLDLINDLESLPDSALVRKIGDIAKRARAARTHAVIIDHLRKKLPFFGKEGALKKMLDDLVSEFQEISRSRSIPLGDFPSPDHFRHLVQVHCSKDLSEFPDLDPSMVAETTEILSSYIPRLVAKHGKASAAAAKQAMLESSDSRSNGSGEQ